MDSTNDMTAEVDEFIQEVNDATMILYTELVCLTIMVYHILLLLDDEIRLVWSKKYNFTTVAYVFTRYAIPLQLVLSVMLALWPQAGTDLSTCNSLANGSNALQAFFLIGVRGLLSMRAYAISRKKWLAIILLGSTFLADIITYLLVIILAPGCLSLESTASEEGLLNAQIASGIANDTVVFVITIYELWSLREIKRSASLGDNDFSMILLKQGFYRYGPVLIIGITQEILSIVTNTTSSMIFGTISTLISSVMVSDFFLTLRRHNLRQPEDDNDSTVLNLNWSVLQASLGNARNNDRGGGDSWSRSIFQTTNDIILAEMTIRDDYTSDNSGAIPLVGGERGGTGDGGSDEGGDSPQGRRRYHRRTLSSTATNAGAGSVDLHNYPPFPFPGASRGGGGGVWANPDLEERMPVLTGSIV